MQQGKKYLHRRNENAAGPARRNLNLLSENWAIVDVVSILAYTHIYDVITFMKEKIPKHRG